MRPLRALTFIVLGGYLLATLFIYFWIRERYGRGGPFPASQAGLALHPLRRWVQPELATLERFHLKPGDCVLELGPGPGYFTIEAARMVGPSGRVACLDIQREMIEILAPRLREHNVANAHPLVGDASRLPLADGSVDAAFLVAVLGEIPDRPAALRELRRVMKPGGILSFSESLTDPDYVLQATLRDLCRLAGFQELELRPGFLGYTTSFVA